jgi:hypothetical protein
MIRPILYERIEQKNEIERELFSKLSAEERRAISKSWMKLMSKINKKPTPKAKSK